MAKVKVSRTCRKRHSKRLLKKHSSRRKRVVERARPLDLCLRLSENNVIVVPIEEKDTKLIRKLTVEEALPILKKYAIPGTGLRLVTESGQQRLCIEPACYKKETRLFYQLKSSDLELVKLALKILTDQYVRGQWSGVYAICVDEFEVEGVDYFQFHFMVDHSLGPDYSKSLPPYYKGEGFTIPCVFQGSDPVVLY